MTKTPSPTPRRYDPPRVDIHPDRRPASGGDPADAGSTSTAYDVIDVMCGPANS